MNKFTMNFNVDGLWHSEQFKAWSVFEAVRLVREKYGEWVGFLNYTQDLEVQE